MSCVCVCVSDLEASKELVYEELNVVVSERLRVDNLMQIRPHQLRHQIAVCVLVLVLVFCE